MKPQCPYYKPPRLVTDLETDKSYEGSAMCELVDKWCLVEYAQRCEEYDNYLKERREGEL